MYSERTQTLNLEQFHGRTHNKKNHATMSNKKEKNMKKVKHNNFTSTEFIYKLVNSIYIVLGV